MFNKINGMLQGCYVIFFTKFTPKTMKIQIHMRTDNKKQKLCLPKVVTVWKHIWQLFTDYQLHNSRSVVCATEAVKASRTWNVFFTFVITQYQFAHRLNAWLIANARQTSQITGVYLYFGNARLLQVTYVKLTRITLNQGIVNILLLLITFIIFSAGSFSLSAQWSKKVNEINLCINHVPMENFYVTKVLGGRIVSKLNWKYHIDYSQLTND